MAGVLPWSYSSLNAFETCPRRYYLTRITRQVKEPETEATLHGTEVHKALELAVKGEAPLPEKYLPYKPLVDRVMATPGERVVEHQFALTGSFKPTGFFDSDAWVRGVIDLGIINRKAGVVLDWKTGKVKTDGDQLKLFAVAAFASFDQLQTVKTGYVWLKHGKLTSANFKREDAPGIWQEFLPRVRRMEKAQEADRWPPNPSGLCRAWCPVGRKLCDFCGTN